MASSLSHSGTDGLERSCGSSAGDRITLRPSWPGLERIEVRLTRQAYRPHRHDTYTVGRTVTGVQAFRYRGVEQVSVAGQLFVLHPDELHDGRAGTPTGLNYHSLYIEPTLVREALGGAQSSLPFVREAVSRDERLAGAIANALDEADGPMEELRRAQVVLELAEALAAADPSFARRRLSTRNVRAVERTRAYLHASTQSAVDSSELESVSGMSRYALARHFRACLGTSPYRYLVMRRLDRARALIRVGQPLAEAAVASGFADQSHMTRHFKRTYGLSPGRWAALTA